MGEQASNPISLSPLRGEWADLTTARQWDGMCRSTGQDSVKEFRSCMKEEEACWEFVCAQKRA